MTAPKPETNPLEKALGDISVGSKVQATAQGVPHGGAVSVHDYGHVLTPESRAAGYQVHVSQQRSLGGHLLQAKVIHQGQQVGSVNAHLEDGAVSIGDSKVNNDHRGRGLGLALYEGLLSHAHNALGAQNIVGDTHSTAAAGVHRALAQKHGLGYQAPQRRVGQKGDYDEAYGPYEYALKTELTKSARVPTDDDAIQEGHQVTVNGTWEPAVTLRSHQVAPHIRRMPGTVTRVHADPQTGKAYAIDVRHEEPELHERGEGAATYLFWGDDRAVEMLPEAGVNGLISPETAPHLHQQMQEFARARDLREQWTKDNPGFRNNPGGAYPPSPPIPSLRMRMGWNEVRLTPFQDLNKSEGPIVPEIHAPLAYVSTSKYPVISEAHERARQLVLAVKSGHEGATQVAAKQLHQHPALRAYRGLVVPVPNSDGPGRNGLANAFANLGEGRRVESLVQRSVPVESSRIRRRAGGVGLTPDEHTQSMSATFAPELADEPILLLDDVATTGATIQGAARALRAAGHRGPIQGAAVARAVDAPVDDPFSPSTLAVVPGLRKSGRHWIFDRSPDAEFMLDHDEADRYDWREEPVRPNQIKVVNKRPWHPDDEARVQEIIGHWGNDPHAGIKKYPVLMHRNGDLIDGYHRAEAWKRLKVAGPMTALVAYPKQKTRKSEIFDIDLLDDLRKDDRPEDDIDRALASPDRGRFDLGLKMEGLQSHHLVRWFDKLATDENEIDPFDASRPRFDRILNPGRPVGNSPSTEEAFGPVVSAAIRSLSHIVYPFSLLETILSHPGFSFAQHAGPVMDFLENPGREDRSATVIDRLLDNVPSSVPQQDFMRRLAKLKHLGWNDMERIALRFDASPMVVDELAHRLAGEESQVQLARVLQISPYAPQDLLDQHPEIALANPNTPKEKIDHAIDSLVGKELDGGEAWDRHTTTIESLLKNPHLTRNNIQQLLQHAAMYKNASHHSGGQLLSNLLHHPLTDWRHAKDLLKYFHGNFSSHLSQSFADVANIRSHTEEGEAQRRELLDAMMEHSPEARESVARVTDLPSDIEDRIFSSPNVWVRKTATCVRPTATDTQLVLALSARGDGETNHYLENEIQNHAAVFVKKDPERYPNTIKVLLGSPQGFSSVSQEQLSKELPKHLVADLIPTTTNVWALIGFAQRKDLGEDLDRALIDRFADTQTRTGLGSVPAIPSPLFNYNDATRFLREISNRPLSQANGDRLMEHAIKMHTTNANRTAVLFTAARNVPMSEAKTQEVLQRHPATAYQIASRDNVPQDVLRSIYHGTDADGAVQALNHIQAPPDILEHAIDSTDPEKVVQSDPFRWAMLQATHPDTNVSVLTAMLHRAIRNPNTPTAAIRRVMLDPHVTDPDVKNAAEQVLVQSDPDAITKSHVRVRRIRGTERLRKIRDIILERAPKTQTLTAKQLPPGDWSQFRDPITGEISAKEIQKHLDTAPTDRWNVASSDRGDIPEWAGAQTHSDQPSKVFQVNLSTEHIARLREAGVYPAFQHMVQATMQSGHPVSPSTIGWVRWTGSNRIPPVALSPINHPQEYAKWKLGEIDRVLQLHTWDDALRARAEAAKAGLNALARVGTKDDMTTEYPPPQKGSQTHHDLAEVVQGSDFEKAAKRTFPGSFKVPRFQPANTGQIPGVQIDEIQSDFGQSFAKQAAGQMRANAIEEARSRGMTPEQAKEHVERAVGRATVQAEAKWSTKDYDTISQILFQGRHPNEVLADAFVQHLRDRKYHGAVVHIHDAETKGVLSGMNVSFTQDPKTNEIKIDRPLPGHMLHTYREVPEKRLGAEKSRYGKLTTQTGEEVKDPRDETKPGVEWEFKIRKAEEDISDWLNGFFKPEDSPLPTELEQIELAANFLAGREPTSADARGALRLFEHDPIAAALHARKLDVDDSNRLAVAALKGYVRSDPSTGVVAPNFVEAVFPQGENFAKIIKQAKQAGTIRPAHLNGKHAAGACLIQVNDDMLLAKPGSGPPSPIAGETQTAASQSRREVAFYATAHFLGIGSDLPECHLLNLDLKEVAVMRYIAGTYRPLGDRMHEHPRAAHDAFEPMRRDGRIYVWGAIDYILGNGDRHLNNVLVDDENHVKLIDDGSAFAGSDFDPGNDQYSFIPCYLRYDAPTDVNFHALQPADRMRYMVGTSKNIADRCRAWLDGIDPKELARVISSFWIDPTPALARLQRLRDRPSEPFDLELARAWCGL